jgi:hypothetical protein
MGYTCKWLSESDLENYVQDGTFKSIYLDSEKHIEMNNYHYPLKQHGAELTTEDKFQYWANRFHGHLNGEFTGGRINKIVCVSKNDKVLTMICGSYDPSTKIWHSSVSLTAFDENNSKSYNYSKAYTERSTSLPRSLGAEHIWLYADIGSNLAFRADADISVQRPTKYNDLSHIFDLANVSVGVETIHYYTKTPDQTIEDVIPHADGTVGSPEKGIVLEDYYSDLHITKLPFNTEFDWTTITGVDNSE